MHGHLNVKNVSKNRCFPTHSETQQFTACNPGVSKFVILTLLCVIPVVSIPVRNNNTFYTQHFIKEFKKPACFGCVKQPSNDKISPYYRMYGCSYMSSFFMHSEIRNLMIVSFLAIDQLNAQILVFYNKFIIFLYMFRAQQCSKYVEEYNNLITKNKNLCIKLVNY